MAITQTITNFPTAPDSSSDTPTEFNTKADAFVNHQSANYVGEVNNWASQANALGNDMDTIKTEIDNIVASIPAGTIDDTKATPTNVYSAKKSSDDAIAQDALIAGKENKADTKYLGDGQTYKDVTATKIWATDYLNDTGRPIFVSVGSYGASGNANIVFFVDNVSMTQNVIKDSGGSGVIASVSFIVPAGSHYSVSSTSGVPNGWVELS